MQTSAERAKFSSVYEWLQVGRLERSQVRRGDLSFSRSGSLARLYSQPMKSKLSALESKLSALPSNVNQPYDCNSLALITLNSPGPNAEELQSLQSALNSVPLSSNQPQLK